MTTQAGILDKGLLAALGLAAETAWADLTLADIAGAADIPLSEFHGLAGKDDLAAHADTYFDKAMSEEGVSRDESPRERLFDVIMLRFEAMEEYRAGLMSLMAYRDRTPSLLLTLPLAERAWRKETSGDFARTMAALDKGLRDAEDRMEQLQRFTGWGKNKTRQDNTADEETKPEET